jgi:hypothetical protein
MMGTSEGEVRKWELSLPNDVVRECKEKKQ